jgi:hypothetical protein
MSSYKVACYQVGRDTLSTEDLANCLVRNARLFAGRAQTGSVDHLRYRQTVLC